MASSGLTLLGVYSEGWLDGGWIMELGERVRQLRKARGWTQTELADLLGTKQGYITDIERGKRPNVQATTLQRMARVFDVTLTELLDPVHNMWAERQNHTAEELGRSPDILVKVLQMWGLGLDDADDVVAYALFRRALREGHLDEIDPADLASVMPPHDTQADQPQEPRPAARKPRMPVQKRKPGEPRVLGDTPEEGPQSATG